MFSNSGYNRYETHYGAILADDLTETRISARPTDILETFDALFVVKFFMPMPVLRLWVHTKDVSGELWEYLFLKFSRTDSAA